MIAFRWLLVLTAMAIAFDGLMLKIYQPWWGPLAVSILSLIGLATFVIRRG